MIRRFDDFQEALNEAHAVAEQEEKKHWVYAAYNMDNSADYVVWWVSHHKPVDDWPKYKEQVSK